MSPTLIVIHGAPASGKLTTAKSLCSKTDARLLDNHTIIDTALSIHNFGDPGFWKLVFDTGMLLLNSAASNNVPIVVTTLCYSHPDDLYQIENFEQIYQRQNGQVFPVFLNCTYSETLHRIGNPDRILRKKLRQKKGWKNSTQSMTLNRSQDRIAYYSIANPTRRTKML